MLISSSLGAPVARFVRSSSAVSGRLRCPPPRDLERLRELAAGVLSDCAFSPVVVRERLGLDCSPPDLPRD
jgi:hypothetical protein